MQKVKQFKDKPVAFHFNGTAEQFATPFEGACFLCWSFSCWVTPERLLYALPQYPQTNDSMSWNVQIKILKTDLYVVY